MIVGVIFNNVENEKVLGPHALICAHALTCAHALEDTPIPS